MVEILLENNIQNKLNTLISKTVKEERKMEGDLDFLYDDNVNVCQKKKKKKLKKTVKSKMCQILQHNKDKI